MTVHSCERSRSKRDGENPMTYTICYAEPIIVGREQVQTLSVTGMHIQIAEVVWFSYVVLPQYNQPSEMEASHETESA